MSSSSSSRPPFLSAIDQVWGSMDHSEMTSGEYESFLRTSWKSLDIQHQSILIQERVVVVPEDNQHPDYFECLKNRTLQDCKGKAALQSMYYPRPPSAVKGYMKSVSSSSPPPPTKEKQMSIKEVNQHLNLKQKKVYERVRKLVKQYKEEEGRNMPRDFDKIVEVGCSVMDDVCLVQEIAQRGICDKFLSKDRPPIHKPRTELQRLIVHKRKNGKAMSKSAQIRLDSKIYRQSVYNQ